MKQILIDYLACCLLIIGMAVFSNATANNNADLGVEQTQNTAKKDVIGKTIEFVKRMGMYNYCLYHIEENEKYTGYSIAPLSYSKSNFQSRNLRIFLLKDQDKGDPIIIDELLFDKKTSDSFGCVDVYDNNTERSQDMFVRYKYVKGNPVLVSLYGCKDGKIEVKQPSKNLEIYFDQP